MNPCEATPKQSTEHTEHTEKIIVKDVVQDSSLDFEP